MKKKKQSRANNYIPCSVGDSFDNAVWSLETIAFSNPPISGAIKRFSGTGFLFKREGVVRGQKHTIYFLVSNKHVLVEDSPSILAIHFPAKGGQPAFRYRLFPTVYKNKYCDDFLQTVVHQDPEADLAVIDVTEKIVEMQNWTKVKDVNFIYKTVNYENIPDSFDFPKGTPIEYLGYPAQSEDPRLIAGRIGKNPSTTTDGNIKLDNITVAQGSSGSPAFIGVNGQPKLLGIMYATESTEIVEGHSEFDQGHAVRSDRLIELTNQILLQDRHFKPKHLRKFSH